MNGAPCVMPPTLPSVVLAPLCNGLCSLNARVAEEFMALAEVLQSNCIRARQITAESHKATGSEANLHTTHSIGVLQRILTDSAGVSAMVEISTTKMRDILAHVKAARAPLQRLTKMRTLLQTIGVMSRIEGGRITNTSVNLSSLSKDIDVLAAQVVQHVQGILDDSSRLSDVLQSGVYELSKVEHEERLETANLIRRVEAVLAPLMSRAETSQVAARDIDEQYANFHGSTNKVVMSLQSEDIARQRVEHVQEAIRRVATSLDAGESMETCASVLVLQRSQLVGTRDLLADSLATIHSGLQSLSPRIQELASRTETLAQQTDKDGQSFASIIDNELEIVVSIFNQCSASAKSVLSIVDNVLPSVDEMTKGAYALEEIEASIHLISVNATVKTAHLGGDGLAMGVIASELCSIAMASEGHTKLVLDALTAISNALAEITNQEAISQSSVIMSSGGEFVSNELADLSESVRASNLEMTVALKQVLQLAEELCAQLERGCELSARAASVTECFDEQLRSFDEVFAKLGYTSEMAASTADDNQVEDLSKLYSMESERKLHIEVFGTNAANGEATSTSSLTSEFGDDVELF